MRFIGASILTQSRNFREAGLDRMSKSSARFSQSNSKEHMLFGGGGLHLSNVSVVQAAHESPKHPELFIHCMTDHGASESAAEVTRMIVDCPIKMGSVLESTRDG